MNNRKLSYALFLLCAFPCGCDDLGSEGDDIDALTGSEDGGSTGDPEACEPPPPPPPPPLPDIVELDRHALAFAQAESVHEKTIQLADGELHLAQVLDEQGALIASFSMEVHDGAIGSVLTRADFAYDNETLEYRVERVASADGTWSDAVDFVSEPTDVHRRMELLSATLFESESVVGPDGEQASIGICVGNGLVTGGACVTCGLCTTGTAGVCFIACSGICAGGMILTVCACGEYGWCP